MTENNSVAFFFARDEEYCKSKQFFKQVIDEVGNIQKMHTTKNAGTAEGLGKLLKDIDHGINVQGQDFLKQSQLIKSVAAEEMVCCQEEGTATLRLLKFRENLTQYFLQKICPHQRYGNILTKVLIVLLTAFPNFLLIQNQHLIFFEPVQMKPTAYDQKHFQYYNPFGNNDIAQSIFQQMKTVSLL